MPGAALRGYGRAYLKRGGSPAWTRSEGKSESGGLNEKGRKSYERANPGDLNKDGKMSGYETARSNAIKKAMSKKNKGKA